MIQPEPMPGQSAAAASYEALGKQIRQAYLDCDLDQVDHLAGRAEREHPDSPLAVNWRELLDRAKARQAAGQPLPRLLGG